MPTNEINEFARLLVRHVRDQAIRSCDRQLDPASRTPIGIRWREVLGDSPAVEVARTVIPDCIDEVIFSLLQAVDQGILALSYTGENGETVNLHQDGLGELSGWYMGTGGWRAQYSQERFVDDFADLGGNDLGADSSR